MQVHLLAQTSPPPTEQKHESRRAFGPIDVLSDTQGVDFGPYLERVLHDVKINWYNFILEEARPPINKKGKVSIEFAILKDGRVSGLRLEQGGSSGDVALDRAAWGGIAASDPFPPLPSEFHGQYLALRFHFYYNPDKGDLDASATATSSKSGITVKIWTPNMLKVPIGGSQVLTATVEGTTNTAVKWSIGGLGCTGSICGTIQGRFYIAPNALPSPPSVTLTATSEADLIASASITIILTPARGPEASGWSFLLLSQPGTDGVDPVQNEAADFYAWRTGTCRAHLSAGVRAKSTYLN